MADETAVTRWIEGLKAGDSDAARRLWEYYFQPLRQVVERRLPQQVRRAFDEEDVVLSAFQSFYTGVAKDQFPQLENRDNLWSLLVVIATRKSQAYLRAAYRDKRGGGKLRGESAIEDAPNRSRRFTLDDLAAVDGSPQMAAELSDLCQRVFDELQDESLQAIAAMKLEAYTIDQIAETLGFTRRTVQRRLELIRKVWQRMIAADEPVAASHESAKPGLAPNG